MMTYYHSHILYIPNRLNQQSVIVQSYLQYPVLDEERHELCDVVLVQLSSILEAEIESVM